MKYEKQQAIIALIIVFMLGYWSFQYYENGKVLDNYHLMLVVFMFNILSDNKSKIAFWSTFNLDINFSPTTLMFYRKYYRLLVRFSQ